MNQSTGEVEFLSGGKAEILVSLKGLENNSDIVTSSVYNVAPRDNVEDATVSGIKNAVYTGGIITQNITVKYGSETLKQKQDYTVSYKNNKNAGTATVVITGTGKYEGVASKNFAIKKAAQPMEVTAKANPVIAKSKPFACVKVKGAKGTVTYANKSTVAKAKKFTVNKKTGKVSVPSGTKAGTYKVRVKATAAGTANFKAGSKTVTVKVRVS